MIRLGPGAEPHTQLLTRMADYARRRDRFLSSVSSPCFFLNDHGRRLEGSAVRRTFYDLSRQIGLRGPELLTRTVVSVVSNWTLTSCMRSSG